MLGMFNEHEADQIVNNILRSREAMEEPNVTHVDYEFITKDNEGNIVRVMRSEVLDRETLVKAFEVARDALEAYDALVEPDDAPEATATVAIAQTEPNLTEVPQQATAPAETATVTEVAQPVAPAPEPIQPVQIPIQ